MHADWILKNLLTKGRHGEVKVGDHDDEEADDDEDDLSARRQAGNALGSATDTNNGLDRVKIRLP